MRFRDRHDAGRRLAAKLEDYTVREDVIVLALPRGGVPVGAEVASALGAPLDVFLVRKLGAPGREELAMGAIASGGVRVLNPDVVDQLRIPQKWIEAVAAREGEELAEWRGHRAIGVVYRPQYERNGNYVPTVLPRRYDAFLYIDQSTGVRPLFRPNDAELPEEAPETYPTGV